MSTQSADFPAIVPQGDPALQRVLAVGVGGNRAKMPATDERGHRIFDSGSTITLGRMVTNVLDASQDRKFEVVAIGCPNPVIDDKPIAEPHNRGRRWIAFDYAAAFGRPVS